MIFHKACEWMHRCVELTACLRQLRIVQDEQGESIIVALPWRYVFRLSGGRSLEALSITESERERTHTLRHKHRYIYIYIFNTAFYSDPIVTRPKYFITIPGIYFKIPEKKGRF
jgi:hypothetical protein